eukprot:5230549-Pleurochrysis_carterae.AAC.1
MCASAPPEAAGYAGGERPSPRAVVVRSAALVGRDRPDQRWEGELAGPEGCLSRFKSSKRLAERARPYHTYHGRRSAGHAKVAFATQRAGPWQQARESSGRRIRRDDWNTGCDS